MITIKRLKTNRLVAMVWLLLIALIVIVGSLLVWQQLAFNDSATDHLQVVFLDVGQGDAILIQHDTDRLFDDQQILIDGGPNQSVLAGVGKFMKLFDRTIDLVVATHPDADHIGGLLAVLDRYQVEMLVDNGTTSDTPVFTEYARRRDRLGNYASSDQIAEYQLTPDTVITVLPTTIVSSDRNEHSVVTRIDHGTHSVLLTGDGGQLVEDYLIANYPRLIDVDILKLGHHGSRTATSPAFLAMTSPDYVVISAPIDSRYGHPHEEVLENVMRYSQTRTVPTQILFTGRDGHVEFELPLADQVRVTTQY